MEKENENLKRENEKLKRENAELTRELLCAEIILRKHNILNTEVTEEDVNKYLKP